MSSGVSDLETNQASGSLVNGKITLKTKSYYIYKSIVSFEEDLFHEFKGHRNLAVEEVPAFCVEKQSRQPVSRSLNGFLNTGQGGTVYLGILDDGTVMGLNLTQYQKDHMVVSLDDLMDRYCPPVEKHRYKIKFVPVVDQGDEDKHSTVLFDSKSVVDSETRRRPHLLKTCLYCWCDKDATARMNSGVIPARYVVEITIKAWNRDDPKTKQAVGKMRTHPIHEDETGRVYLRGQANVRRLTMDEVAVLTKQSVLDFYEPKIEELRKELSQLKAEYNRQSASSSPSSCSR